ncbi:MAG: hypothetical protein ACI4T1_01890 [Christensenellales bacterium]
MKYTNEFSKLCRELFFRTGLIGYYVMAINVEKCLQEDETLER